MKPAISIVIPAMDSAATLQSCLESIRAQSFKDYELIVVDGLSRDGTAGIARRYADKVITCPGSVPASRNAGFSQARGGIFLSIDSDMVLGEGLLRDVSEKMEENDALIIPELGCGRGFLARLKELEKRCYLGDATVESARAFRRDAFLSAGGYDASLHFGEDRDIHLRIAQRWRIGRTDARLLHDTTGLSLTGDLRKAFRYGKSAGRFFSKPLQKGAGSFGIGRVTLLRYAGTLMREPLHGACLLALRAAELSAFGLGLAWGGALRALRPRRKEPG